jgi:hypothetical protein
MGSFLPLYQEYHNPGKMKIRPPLPVRATMETRQDMKRKSLKSLTPVRLACSWEGSWQTPARTVSAILNEAQDLDSYVTFLPPNDDFPRSTQASMSIPPETNQLYWRCIAVLTETHSFLQGITLLVLNFHSKILFSKISRK